MNTEKTIEYNLIKRLIGLNYTYREDIHDKEALEQNFRQKFEQLNRVHLSDAEYNRLLEDIINSDVYVASKMLREVNTFIREDGTPLQYSLVNIRDWCKNEYEVVNQLRINTKNSFQRYDVILLVNGLPLVQIELKTLEVSPRRAMQQIVDYKNDIGNGFTNSLLCFMQLFIVSNQTHTCYFTNNNSQYFNFNADEQFLPVYYWADKDNHKITNLDAFTDEFLSKCKLGEMISRYMVLVASEQKLLIMRPYQIYAVKAIMSSVEENRGNGYIWHTTGSGKTLTSFKASTLLKQNREITKCLFVVDRKDLDRQTREEFNKFQENCVEENTNTESLVQRLESDDYADKVIVTTIQKLGIALNSNTKQNYKERLLPLKNKHLVFIFDECHRSQFKENHKAIKDFFPNAQLFGFTGTPIFEENAVYIQYNNEQGTYMTTKDVFENELHTYTITHAIEDKNVLRFHVDYFKPDEKKDITAEGTVKKQAIIETILSKHDAATNGRRFNAFLATSSINDAIEYYHLFKKAQEAKTDCEPLNIACVFTPPAEGNKDIMQMQEDLAQERQDNTVEPEKKKLALQEILKDYERQFGAHFTINEFDAYYQDVQKRIKDQQYSNKDYPHKNKIDITIVVDMLLTGFDSKYLNTLYVDKNLRYHNLIQAFSRTNRILNDTKPYGNILDFRGQQEAVDIAITRFSGVDVDKPRTIWLVDPAPTIVQKYKEAVTHLKDFMHSQDLECKPEEVYNLQGDDARIGFVNCFKEVQRYRTQLDQYTDISEEERTAIDNMLNEESLRGFRGAYLETAKQLKKQQDRTKEGENPQIENVDFEFVLFASTLIDYDYIMELIARLSGGTTSKQKMTKEQIISLIKSSSNLLEERDDIIAYLNSLKEGVNGKTVKQIKEEYEIFKTDKYAKELLTIADKHNISAKALEVFVNEIIDRKIFDGEKLNDLLAPLNLGWRDRTKKELALMEDVTPLLKRLSAGQEISGLSAYDEKK